MPSIRPQCRCKKSCHRKGEDDLAITLRAPSGSVSEFSTGDCPATPSEKDSDTDSYSPPMYATLLPDRPSSAADKILFAFIDSVFSSPVKTLRWQEYDHWKDVLCSCNFKCEDYRRALLHAIDLVVKTQTSSEVGAIAGL